MSPAKKSSSKKAATTKKAATKKATPAKKKAAVKKAVAKKSAVKKASAKKASPKKAATKKATPAKKKAAPATTRATTKRAPAKRSTSTRPAPVREDAADEAAFADASPFAPPEGPALAGPAARTVEPYRPTPSTVVVGFDGPGPQRRLTVAFRLILAIPHLIVLWLLSIAAFFVIVIGWFAALALGRLPDGFARFLGNVVEYGTRVSAYGFYLLTDRYPPFSFGSPYAVSVDIVPGQLNRAAVFFRLIIAIPAYVVVTVLQYGYWAAAIFIWLIVLVAGQMPTALWQANAAVLRYLTRYYAYLALVTSEYPWGLFGDRE